MPTLVAADRDGGGDVPFDGHSEPPRGSGGRTAESGWQAAIRPFVTGPNRRIALTDVAREASGVRVTDVKAVDSYSL